VVFVIIQCGSRSPLNYTISISLVIAALFRFWLGTKSRFQLHESTAMKREWWSPWLSYSDIRNTARQIPVERSRGKQESQECLYSALLRAAKRLGENFKFLGRICGWEYRKPGGSAKLNTIAQSREISNLPLYANCGLRLCVCELLANTSVKSVLFTSSWRVSRGGNRYPSALHARNSDCNWKQNSSDREHHAVLNNYRSNKNTRCNIQRRGKF